MTKAIQERKQQRHGTGTHRPAPERNDGWNVRFLWLIALAGMAVGVTIWAEWRSDGERVWAQESPFESPVLFPTPTKIPRTVNEVVHPKDGDAIAGETEIIGTALIADFMRYDIHIARAGEDRWSWVASSSEVVHDDVLLVLNTRGFADGRYDLRVRAVDMRGTFTEEFVRNLEIRNARPPTPTPDPNVTPAPRAPLPTPTPTPDMTARLPGGTGFYSPDMGAVLRGNVEITGALGGRFRNPLTRWELAISPFEAEVWSVIRSGSEQGMGITFMVLDTTQYPDGLYDLRLRAVYQDGDLTDYFLRQLSFANAGAPQFVFLPRPGIVSPEDGLFASGILPVIATIPVAGLLHWELAWLRQGEEVEAEDDDPWRLLTTGDEGGVEIELARLDLSRLPSGVYDMRLRIVRRDAAPHDSFVRGLQVQGLPLETEEDDDTIESEVDNNNSE